ncbi:MAG: hypothetical protein AB4041_04815 [Microcystaceae cyanobacterium]
MEEAITWLLIRLGALGTGILSKAGSDIFDAGRQLLTRKLTGTSTGKALSEGTEIDSNQAVIDIEAIAQDPEIEQLLQQIQALLSQNEELKRQVQEAIKQQPLQKNIQIIKDKSQGYQFNDKVETQFIGGIHYHDK